MDAGLSEAGWNAEASQVSSGLLQTAQTWANAGVCGGQIYTPYYLYMDAGLSEAGRNAEA